MNAKNPRQPPAPLTVGSGEVRLWSQAVFRIHAIAGAHPTRWNELREFGPLDAMLWDPQPPPKQHHTGIGVAYLGSDATTAFAEVFQSRRAIHLTEGRALSGWIPSRELRLLDLTTLWPVRNGASASLHAAPKSTCRNWSREIHRQLGHEIDGLCVPSTMTLAPIVVLFTASTDAFPEAPDFSRPLSHTTVQMLALRAATELDWPII